MENIHDKMHRIGKSREKAEPIREQKAKAIVAKRQFSGVLDKKFKTTFIGAISQIQDAFGELWGENKQEEDRTEQEREWYDIWQQVRTNILNNGNNQLRAALNELQQYNIIWEGYKLNLPIMEENNERKPPRI
jgi:hypothetical protein